MLQLLVYIKIFTSLGKGEVSGSSPDEGMPKSPTASRVQRIGDNLINS